MDLNRSHTILLAVAALSLAAPAAAKDACTVSDWPEVAVQRPADPELERRVAAIVSGMTLAQKIGQMTQPDIRYVTPDDVRRYYIGSVLNGGGAWPAMDKRAKPSDWAALSSAYYTASMATDMKVPVPVIWGTDAVHGHNNVYRATLFPHNIALGAAHDADLVYRIGRSTALAVRATGITWAFAPTLAVVQNQRWGRVYESYSADPALVRDYAGALVKGLQGDLAGNDDVLATAKHFLGDGGTYRGVDQGETRTTGCDLIARHGNGYYGALEAGVQTVMVSYSSWTDTAAGVRHGKMHGNRGLITDVLKQRLDFDGIVISDWNAIEQVPGCERARCAKAVNAGIDMFMVPEDWKAFIANTIADVESGRIPAARIDDAVSRIVRVKLRSGLFEGDPANAAALPPASAIDDAELAREAVRKSLVLLKNERAALPLARDGKILVIGGSADSFAKQSGGWSRTWQGPENENADFGTGETLLSAIAAKVGAPNVQYAKDASGLDLRKYEAVIVVLGEAPYAEMKGDIRFPAPLTHSHRYPEDLAALETVAGKGIPVVTVLYSGRTVFANDLINRSDAFVAAWLPGTEADGIADVLFRAADGAVAHDFTGRLPFAWPGNACDDQGARALFPMGYGLSYAKPAPVGQLSEKGARGACRR